WARTMCAPHQQRLARRGSPGPAGPPVFSIDVNPGPESRVRRDPWVCGTSGGRHTKELCVLVSSEENLASAPEVETVPTSARIQEREGVWSWLSASIALLQLSAPSSGSESIWACSRSR